MRVGGTLTVSEPECLPPSVARGASAIAGPVNREVREAGPPAYAV